MGNLLSSWKYREPSTVEECDSTWESDSESDDPQAAGDINPADEEEAPTPQLSDDAQESAPKLKRSFYAAKDLYKYRHSYPNYRESRQVSEFQNLRFYLNKIPLVPDGIYIEEILNEWKGDYEKLEHNHTYIQWLFPLREQGLNFYAQELTQDEIKEFQNNREAKRRFIIAYTVMLDFFGIKLLDKNGSVSRASNWCERFQHLNESQHNYLRITRILKSLGELGFESFKAPLVKFLLKEALIEETVPNMKQSALEYFVYTIRDRKERRSLLRFAQLHYRPSEHFIWGPPKKRKAGAKINCPVDKMSVKSKPEKDSVSKNTPTAPSNEEQTGDETKKSDESWTDDQVYTGDKQNGGSGEKQDTEEKSYSDETQTSTENKAIEGDSSKIKSVNGGKDEKDALH
uniref:Opioid growth factor receptor like 1 n=1 Tax=Erpetoichthys calabaricus TaxID=27687 RepID=A0A8C4T704_ERPCA